MNDTSTAVSRVVPYFRRWLAPPIFDDEDKTRIAAIFNTLILSAVAVLLGLLTTQIALGVENPRNVAVALVTCALLLGIRQIARRGQGSLAILFFCSLWLVGLSLIAYNNGTIRAMGVAGLVTCVIVPTLLIGRRTGLIFAGLTVTFVFGLARAEAAGALPSLIPAQLGPTNQWLVFTAIILFHWILVSAARNSMVKALERARQENTTRRHAEENLRELNASLEKRVGERTVELEREILERKRAEEAQRESESRLQAIIDNYPFHVFIKTVPESRYILVNPSWREANHITGALQGQTDHELFPTMVEQLREEDAMVIETGKPHSFERTLKLPDGHRPIHLVTKFPLFNAENMIYAIGGIAVDITERKQIEEALRESEARYRSIFQSSGVSIWEEDFSEVKEALDKLRLQGVTDFRRYFDEHPDFVREAMQLLKVIDVNETTLALYGAKNKAEFLASLDTIFTSETLETFKEELITLAEQKIYFEGEVTDRTLRGDTLHLWRTIVFPREKARFKSVLVCLTNITERKRAEEALRESEERLRFVMAAIQDAVYDCDFRNGQVFRNEAYQVLYSSSETTSVDEPWWENHIHPNDRQGIMERLNDTFRERKQAWSGEYRFGRHDGTYAFVMDHGHIIYDVNGQPIRMIGAIIDITERKRAEETLRESEERLRFVMAATQDAVYDWDIRSGQVFRNEAYQMLFSPNEPVGTDETWWENQMHPHDHKRILESLGQTFHERKQAWSGEYRFRRHDGTYASVIDRGFVIYDNEGQPIRMIGAILDFTEQKHAEENLHRHNERLAFLYEIVLKLLRQDNIDDLSQTITEEVSQLVHADVGYLALVEGEMLVDRAISPRDLPYRLLVGKLKEDESIVRDVIESRQKVVVTDLSSQPRITPQTAALGLKATFYLPLLTPDSCQGVVAAGRSMDNPFTEEDIFLGNLFTRVAGLALDNTRLRETLRHEATHDSLTGLHNRSYLFDALTHEVPRAIRENYPISIILLDIDHFKIINDTFGHDAGDEALRVLAAQLKSLSRAEDILCRYGGDEHLIVMHTTAARTAVERAEQLRKAIAETRVSHAGKTFEITSSFGVAVFPDHGKTIEEVISVADRALYRSKQKGRNCVTLL